MGPRSTTHTTPKYFRAKEWIFQEFSYEAEVHVADPCGFRDPNGQVCAR